MSAPATPVVDGAALPAVGELLPVLQRAVDLALLPGQEGVWAAGLLERTRSVPPSAPEVASVVRLLARCRPQLERAGLTVPGRAQDAPAPTAAPPTEVPRGRRAVVAAEVKMRPDGRVGMVNTPFAIKDVIKALPGARWDKAGKAWHVPATPACVVPALAAFDSHGVTAKVSPKVRALAEELYGLPERRKLIDPAEPVPEIDLDACALTVPPWEHQTRGLAFLAGSSAALLAMPMGAGKTITTIGALNAAGDTRVLVVCPKRVKGVWRREFATKSDRAWHVVDGTRRNKAWRSGQRKRIDLDVPARVREMDETLFDCGCGAAHAVVINYDNLTDPAVADWVPQARIDTIVYDEVHKIKNHRTTNRDRKTEVVTKTVSGVAADWVPYSRRRIGLTGTPIAQTPLDIFGQFRALDPGIFGTKWQRGAEADPNTTPEGFRDRYAVENPYVQGMVYKDRFNNLDELAAKFRSITYRPSVDLKTPGTTHQTFRVELDAPARRVYDKVKDEFYADLTAFADGHQETSSGNIMTALLRLQQLAKGTLVADPVEGPDGRMLPGEHVKVWDVGPKGDRPSPTGEAFIEALDQVGCTAEQVVPVPVVVYCRFRSDLDQVRDIVERRGLRYAELSGRRDDAIDNETGWMRTDCDVAGVQIQAGGTGIELTRSHVAVWWSIGYSLVDFDQASKRQDRPGQTEVVTNIYLVTEDTADEEVYKALDARRSTVAEVFRRAGFSDPVVRAMVENAQAHAQDGETVDGVDGCEREEVDSEGRVMRSVAIPWLDDVFTGRTIEVWPGVPV